MTSLLPMDTIQHILSFNHVSNMRDISKSFRMSFDRYQDIIKRSRQKIVDENVHHFAPDVPFDETKNKTFVVRPAGEPLMESVKALGNDVIIHEDFDNCVRNASFTNGDR